MKREFLKAMGLTDEQIDDIMAEHGKTVTPLRTERDNLRTEIDNRDGQIKTLEKAAGNATNLQSELDKVKAENQTWADRFSASQLDAGIKLAVAKDANDANDMLFFIKKDGLKLKEDGTIEGLDTEITRLKSEKPYLFNATEAAAPEGDPATPPAPGTPPPPPTPPAGFTPPAGSTNNPKDPDPTLLGKKDAERFASRLQA